MEFKERIAWYVNGCRESVQIIEGIRNNSVLDVTLTQTEKFDYLFKKNFIEIYEKEQEKHFIKKNNFKGKTITKFVAEMFYLILTTSDNYNFEILQKVLQKITKTAHKRKYEASRVSFEVTENENKYNLKVTTANGNSLTYSIEGKESYVVCLSQLLTVCFAKSNKTMVYDFYKDYLQHEIMKIESGTEITPYVEWTERLFLREYFESVKPIEDMVVESEDSQPVKEDKELKEGDLDIETYLKITGTSDELRQGMNKDGLKELTQKEKEEDFYKNSFLSVYGMMPSHNDE